MILLVLGLACEAVEPLPPVAAVRIVPQSWQLEAGDSLLLAVTLLDARGDTLPPRPVRWASADTGVARVSDQGRVFGRAIGSTTIAAVVEGQIGFASIAVLRPVAAISVAPAFGTAVPGGLLKLSAMLFDSAADTLRDRQARWSTSDAAVAVVDSTGWVSFLAPGAVAITARSGHASDGADFTVRYVSFVTLSPGDLSHTCGVTTDGRAFCWGFNGSGVLGVGWKANPATPRYVLTPLQVRDTIAFATVDAGESLTCGLNVAGAAYCWGFGPAGELGIGSLVRDTAVPVPVAGGLTFRLITAGRRHACGITVSGPAYCWGSDMWYTLGDDSTIANKSSPTLVAGGIQFVTLSAGYNHTCGIATDSTAYCWGLNSQRQLGTGDTSLTLALPTPVAGGLRFAAISSAGTHTCGLLGDGTAYCWGSNQYGQLGDGSTIESAVPVRAANGFTFSQIASGGSYYGFTCGLQSDGAGYCWGTNHLGVLGSGTSDTTSTVPLPIAGGLRFSAIWAGGFEACALAVDGIAYCWGDNFDGELGIGVAPESRIPARVAGQP